MEQGASAVVITMLIVFVFIPALYLGTTNANSRKINDAMYLSTKVIEDCVENTTMSEDEIAMGYAFGDDTIMRVKIDEGKVFTLFDKVLFENIANPEQYEKIQKNIVCRMIIYPDRYVMWTGNPPGNANPETRYNAETGKLIYSFEEEFDKYEEGKKDEKVSAPKYFTYKKVDLKGRDEIQKLYLADGTSGYYYINTINDKVRKLNNKELWKDITTNISDCKSNFYYDPATLTQVKSVTNQKQLSTFDKNQVIIDIINKDIGYATNGVKMDFINPASAVQKKLKASKKDFNFFNGITFLVIYKDNNILALNQGQVFNFDQYIAAGYTLEN